MMLRSGSYHDVGETRCQALPPRPIGHRAGNPRCRRIENKDAVTVKVQYGFQPGGQIRALARRSFTPQFGNPVLDFRHRNNGDKQRVRMAIYPFDKRGRHWP